jgi:hypothetical protein
MTTRKAKAKAKAKRKAKAKQPQLRTQIPFGDDNEMVRLEWI